MKVCVCGGTNPATNPKFYSNAIKMGKLLCVNDVEMVWGGNPFGVLSLVHEQYLENKKSNTLVMPKAYEEDLKLMKSDKKNQKIYKTEQVMERTQQMFALSDVVVILPGGIGTIYEFWTALEAKRAGEYDITIILLNYKDFFKHQLKHFDFINKNGFTKIGVGGSPYKIEPTELFKVVRTPEEVIDEIKRLADFKNINRNNLL